jgi:transcriptional regulator with GAF, ATPase, and Fis domain/tetratricopeptide (TPR) repeat protein
MVVRMDRAPLGLSAGSIVNGRYRVAGRAGEGAAGTVYIVEDITRPAGSGKMALKLHLLPGSLDAESAGHEFRMLTRLGHPNLAKVHDFGVVVGGGRRGPPLYFHTRRYVEGTSLDRALGPGCPDETVTAALAVLLRVLHYIHSRSVLHGDIKPDNIVCPPDGAVARLKLIDFGLARVKGAATGAPGGSLMYLAPELLRGGEPDERTDLYALGAALAHAATGRMPFAGEDLAEMLESKKGPPPAISEARPGLDPKTRRTIMRLLDGDPGERFVSAASALAFLTGEDAASSPVVLPGTVMVGFEGPMGELRSLLEGKGRTALVTGGVGSGKSRLIEEFKWQAQVEGVHVVQACFSAAAAGSPDPWHTLLAQLAALAGGDPDEGTRALAPSCAAGEGGACGCGAEGRDELIRLEERIAGAVLSLAGSRCLLILEDVHLAGEEGVGIGAYLVRSVIERGGPPLVLCAQDRERVPERIGAIPGVRVVKLQELDAGGVARLVRDLVGRPAPRLSAAIVRCVGGLPLMVEETVRHLAARGALVPDEIVDVQRLDLPGGIEQALVGRLEMVEPWVRGCVEFGAVFGRPWGWDEVEAFAPGLLPREAGRTGFDATMDGLGDARMLARVDADHVDFASPSVREIVYRRCGEGTRRRIHTDVAGRLGRDGATDVVFYVHHLLRSDLREGDRDRAAALALEAARTLVARHAFGAAEDVLRGGISISAARTAAFELGMELGDVLCVTGKFDEAAAMYEDMLREGAGEARPELLERLGSVLEMKGSYAEAALRLEEAVGEGLGEGRLLRALDTLAKVRMMTGQFGTARELAGRGLRAGASGSLRGGFLRTLSLVASYEGKVEEARVAAGEAAALARSMGDERGEALAESCAAMIDQRRGDLRAALDHYRLSESLYETSGFVGGLPVVLMNVGTIHYQLGEFTAALEKFRSSLAVARRIEKLSTIAASMINLGNLLIYFGAHEEARLLLEEAGALSEKHGMKGFGAKARLCLAEAALLMGKTEEAASTAAGALEVFRSIGSQVDLLEAALLKGESDLAAGRPGDALRAAEEIVAGAARIGSGRYEASGLTLKGRSLDALGGMEAESVGDLRRSLGLAESGRHAEETWKAHGALAAFLAKRGELELAERHRSAAVDTLTGLAYAVPAAYRESFWKKNPARAALRGEKREARAAGAPSAFEGEKERMFRLLEINRRILSEGDAQRLLELAMDTAVDLFHAERGFLILKEDRGKMTIAVARNIDRETIRGAMLKISRSIAEKVARTGQPLITMSAQDDERFSATRSVHELKLKSVMAVPIRGRSRILGTIYIDNRFQMNLFSREDLRLLLSFADVIAVALENIEIMEENRRRQRELEEAKARLDEMVRRQARKLDLAMRDLEAKQTILEFKYDYSNIIGRSPAMLRVLQTIERVTDSAVPVLVEGESGTGKELVARTIHFNGPRRKGHFVSINCGALPETLLESELFGYRKGAFTGAQEDKEGLLSTAHGGTVFLDEIGEMSAAMQVKLLRFMQSGEMRQLGSSHDMKVDVRVVAATNKSLEALVKRGAFREDLFYRVNVVAVVVPPLRERREDIPELARHFLEKFSGEMKLGNKSLTKKAMELLLDHPWPGNVRELENVLKNALILSDGERIAPADLHLSAVREGDQAAGSGSLSLESLEEENIRKVLGISGGNKAEAARKLGIGRMTLYRKMKKYRIEE